MAKTADPRRVEYVPLEEVREDPRNPRTHDEELIGASIGRFGVLDLITLDERTGFIVSGHGRRKTYVKMEQRGDSPPEGVKVGQDGRWLVPVVKGWASRSDMEARAALIALNRTTELGSWVDDELLDLLNELEDEEGGLDGIGFTPEDLDRLDKYLEAADAVSTGNTDFGGDQEPTIPDQPLQFTLTFADEDEKSEWMALIKTIRAGRSDRTITGLLIETLERGLE